MRLACRASINSAHDYKLQAAGNFDGIDITRLAECRNRVLSRTRHDTTRHRVIRHRRGRISPWNFRRRAVFLQLEEWRQFIQTMYTFLRPRYLYSFNIFRENGKDVFYVNGFFDEFF